jgi:outer membrane immunogenic protein
MRLLARSVTSRFAIVLVVSAAAALLGGNRCADAADMRLKTPRETPAAQYTWTGFYAGAHAGEAWGTSRFNDPTFTLSPISFDVTSQGPLAGGQLGINWQSGYFVIGAEADVDWASLRGNYLFNPTIGASEVSSSIRALATGTGRVGLAMGPWLAYGKGGVAWADVEFTTNLFNNSVVSVIQQRTGLTAGLGLEVAFWESVSAKVEYDYLVFGQHTVTFQGLGVFRPFDIDEKIHVVKAGFNVRFGGSAAMARN